MMDETGQSKKDEERRRHFRVDDVISVVANPIHVDKEKSEEFAKTIATSRVISLMESQNMDVVDDESVLPKDPDNKKLYEMMIQFLLRINSSQIFHCNLIYTMKYDNIAFNPQNPARKSEH